VHDQGPCTHTKFHKNHQYYLFKIKIAVEEESIETAIAECDQFLKPNYTEITRKHTLERTTLIRRYISKTISPREATYLYYALFIRTQEEALISQINKLLVRSLPPTNAIVTNLAKEILGKEVDKN
jgi:hypothetical protein